MGLLGQGHNLGGIGGVGGELTPFGSPIGWWKASDLVLNDADPVATWAGVVGGNVAQAVEAKQPTYRATTASLNNQPTVQFDGGDNVAFATLTNAVSDYTFFFVIDPVTFNNSTIYSLFDTATGRIAIEVGKGAVFIRYWDATGYYGSVVGADTAQLLVFKLKAAASGEIFRNGASIEDSLNYTQRAIGGTSTLGSHTNETNNFNGHIAEVIIYNSALSDSNRSTTEAYLNDKYSIY